MATRKKKTAAKKSATKKKARTTKKTTTRKAPARKGPTRKATPAKDPVSAVLKNVKSTGIRRWSDCEARGEVSEVIPTGIDVLDRHVFGCSDGKGNFGLPVGRASEVFADEGAGKTSFLLKCLAQCQQAGGIAAIAENEASLDSRWAKLVHGLDMDQLIILEADCMEDTTDQICELVAGAPPSVGPILIGWDSIAATPTRAEISGLLDDDDPKKTKPGERAKLLSETCRKLAGILKGHRAHLMFVNQVRDKIGVMFGSKTTTPGGHAVKFYSSLRVQLKHAGAVKSKNDHSGKDVKFQAVKNKLSVPWRHALVRLDYRTGWDDQWSTLAHAMDSGIMPARSKGQKAYEEALTKLGWPLPEVEL